MWDTVWWSEGMRQFIHYIKHELIILVITLVLFALVFYLYGLPSDVFLIACMICLFTMAILFCIRATSFKASMSKSAEIDRLTRDIKALRAEQYAYQEEIESFFLMWVHQIKTPITATKLMLETAKDSQTDAIRQELLQIDTYTNLALNYLKLMNDDTDMVIMRVPIDDIVRPLLKRYSIQFIHHNTKLNYNKVNEDVLTDAKWASILIEQLLSNALKYAKGKEIWVTFDASSKSLSIRDSGTGISRADLPKIFDKSFSGFNGRLNEKSSGIGLFIVNSISKKLNITVNVTSQLKVGTTFTVTFPENTSYLTKM